MLYKGHERARERERERESEKGQGALFYNATRFRIVFKWTHQRNSNRFCFVTRTGVPQKSFSLINPCVCACCIFRFCQDGGFPVETSMNCQRFDVLILLGAQFTAYIIYINIYTSHSIHRRYRHLGGPNFQARLVGESDVRSWPPTEEMMFELERQEWGHFWCRNW